MLHLVKKEINQIRIVTVSCAFYIKQILDIFLSVLLSNIRSAKFVTAVLEHVKSGV